MTQKENQRQTTDCQWIDHRMSVENNEPTYVVHKTLGTQEGANHHKALWCTTPNHHLVVAGTHPGVHQLVAHTHPW